jgi:hypothetical protein
MKRIWSDDMPIWANLLGWVIGIIIGFGLLFGVLCLEGWLAMLLWNATLPVIFSGVATISFWQSVGINILASILFGGVGRTISAFIEKD